MRLRRSASCVKLLKKFLKLSVHRESANYLILRLSLERERERSFVGELSPAISSKNG
jgi:hypothetical protein